MLFEDEGLKRISIVGLYVCCFPLILAYFGRVFLGGFLWPVFSSHM